jgi:tetratricopeptide (TPR) repeat protein
MPLTREKWMQPRGAGRDRVLIVETSMLVVPADADPDADIRSLLNRGLQAASAEQWSEAAECYARALPVFSDAMREHAGGGYRHNFHLQGPAATAAVRWAEAAKALGDVGTALKLFEWCYETFHAAMEEQAGEEDWWARQWAAEAQLRRGDLLAQLGRPEEARRAWKELLPTRTGFIWPSLMDWADEASERLAALDLT